MSVRLFAVVVEEYGYATVSCLSAQFANASALECAFSFSDRQQ